MRCYFLSTESEDEEFAEAEETHDELSEVPNSTEDDKSPPVEPQSQQTEESSQSVDNSVSLTEESSNAVDNSINDEQDNDAVKQITTDNHIASNDSSDLVSESPKSEPVTTDTKSKEIRSMSSMTPPPIMDDDVEDKEDEDDDK